MSVEVLSQYRGQSRRARRADAGKRACRYSRRQRASCRLQTPAAASSRGPRSPGNSPDRIHRRPPLPVRSAASARAGRPRPLVVHLVWHGGDGHPRWRRAGPGRLTRPGSTAACRLAATVVPVTSMPAHPRLGSPVDEPLGGPGRNCHGSGWRRCLPGPGLRDCSSTFRALIGYELRPRILRSARSRM